MIVESQAVGPFFKNGYIAGCEQTREAVLIDPGDEVPSLLAFAERSALKIRHILLTHAHINIHTGLPARKRAIDGPVYFYRDDLFLYERVIEIGKLYGLTVEPQPPIDVFYEPGQIIAFGSYEVRWHHTPGHCPGGVCLQIGATGSTGKELFVGDTLFAGSIGRTDLPGGDYQVLMASIKNVLFPLGDDAIVHSGHGPDTTIGQERRSNPFLTAGR